MSSPGTHSPSQKYSVTPRPAGRQEWSPAPPSSTCAARPGHEVRAAARQAGHATPRPRPRRLLSPLPCALGLPGGRNRLACRPGRLGLPGSQTPLRPPARRVPSQLQPERAMPPT